MSLQSELLAKVTAVLTKMNLWETNAKKTEELEAMDEVDASSLVRVSVGGVSKKLELQKLIDASVSTTYNYFNPTGQLTFVDNELTIPNSQWLINAVNYQKLTPTVIEIPFSETGKTRIDLIYANTLNQILKETGFETVGVAIPPNLPFNTVEVTKIVVTDSEIESITPPSGGIIYIKSNEDLTLANRKGDTLYGILDQYTGEEITLSKTTDTNDADGVIYFDFDGEKFKRNYVGHADVRWFGAKGDGLDLGIGSYVGDHDAINNALRICKKVILKDGVFLVKKPIYLNSGNDFLIDENATLKLGDASNCTLIKNKAVDFYKDGNGVATYPIGYVRDKNIRLHGKGKIDFNGWMQNRADDSISSIHDNPAVVGTPRFSDGPGIGNYYTGVGAKLADIDNLFIGGGLTTINARTYTILIGGINKYVIDDLFSRRSYYVQNQDFFDINGGCYDGIINNVRGNSGDEFIVLATTSLGDETLRSGDIKRLVVSNISYFGINPLATTESQIYESDFEDGFTSHRLARVSYTKDFVVDDITFINCNSTNSKMHAQIVVSKLPYSGGDTVEEVYSGNGYIGKLTIDNVGSPNSEGLLDFGDYTTVKNLVLNNIIDRRVAFGDPRGFIANYENFTGEVVDFTHSTIENLSINNIKTIIGGGSNPSQSWLKFAGEIKNLTIDNYNIATEQGSEADVMWNFIEGNVKYFWLSNSDFSQFNKIFDLSNTDCVFFENNCTYRPGKDTETQGFARVNSSTFIMDTDDIAIAVNGDIVRTSTGLKMFNGTFWQNLNKPVLTTGKYPIQGVDDLVDSDFEKADTYTHAFGNPTKAATVSIHKSPGFFGDTTPFTKHLYDGFNMFKTWMDGSWNTVFESIQKGTEQSGIIFRVNSINVLNLKKTGIAQFISRVKGLDATETDDFVTLGQLLDYGNNGGAETFSILWSPDGQYGEQNMSFTVDQFKYSNSVSFQNSFIAGTVSNSSVPNDAPGIVIPYNCVLFKAICRITMSGTSRDLQIFAQIGESSSAPGFQNENLNRVTLIDGRINNGVTGYGSGDTTVNDIPIINVNQVIPAMSVFKHMATAKSANVGGVRFQIQYFFKKV